MHIYVNKINDGITFKIKAGYKLELLSPETMKLFRSAKKEDCENVPKLESFEVVLVYCNLVNNNYQQASKVLFTLVVGWSELIQIFIVFTSINYRFKVPSQDRFYWSV